jgi:predicted sulfurtransferase
MCVTGGVAPFGFEVSIARASRHSPHEARIKRENVTSWGNRYVVGVDGHRFQTAQSGVNGCSVIDTRNISGRLGKSFDGAIDPRPALANFRGRPVRRPVSTSGLVMFCTGGIGPRKIDELFDRSVQDVSPGAS